MGRNKKIGEKKKVKLSIVVDFENDVRLNEYKINKSKFINWLLLQHYGKETL